VCAVNALKCTLSRYARTIFIIGARGKIILYRILTSIIDVALRARVIPFSCFLEIKASLISSNAVPAALFTQSYVAYCTEIVTQHAHQTLYHQYAYEFIYRYTDSNISFTRSTSCCASESILWISILNMIWNWHWCGFILSLRVSTHVVCTLRYMRVSCVGQIRKERKRRRKIKTLVIVIVRALLNARMSYYVNIIFIFLFAEYSLNSKKKKKEKSTDATDVRRKRCSFYCFFDIVSCMFEP